LEQLRSIARIPDNCIICRLSNVGKIVDPENLQRVSARHAYTEAETINVDPLAFFKS